MNPPNDLTISVQLRAKDVAWSTRQYLFSRRFLPSLAILMSVTAFALSVGAFSAAYICGAVMIFIFVMLPWIRAAIAMRNPVMQSTFCHTFSDSGIATKFQGGSIALDWQHIGSAKETREYVGIRGKRGAPMVIPKSQLGAEELASLRKILVHHLQNRAKVLG
jgi:hypothetical protein